MLLPFIATVILGQQARLWPLDWNVVVLAGTNVTVEFPQKTTSIDQSIRGRDLSDRLLGARTTHGYTGYVLVYCNLPKDADPKTFLPAAWDEHVEKMNKGSVVLSKEFGQWQGKPTLEGSYQLGKKSYYRVRLVISGNLLYQQLAVSGDGAYDKQVFDRFFNSLKFD